MGRDLKEHAPLSKWDEFPIHQCNEPIRYIATTDPRAFERYWFSCWDDRGELFLTMGLGFYPNLGTIDAYAILVHDNAHTSVRAHGLMQMDRGEIKVGPLCAEMIEPFTEWRLTLGENPQELCFDLRWRDSKRAIFSRSALPGPSGTRNFRLHHEWAGYETFGVLDGKIKYKGKDFQLDAARFRGSRDHHWGIRNGVGGPGHMLPETRTTHVGQWVEFKDWSIWGQQMLFNLGDSRPGATPVRPFDHKLRFDPVTKHLIGGIISNRLPNGEIREVTYEQVGNQVVYGRCALYAGPDGRGTPEENYHHGMYVGDNVVGGETYDISDPNVRMRIAGFEDHVCRAHCNGETVIGLLEGRNPVLYELCRRGRPGFSILE